MTNTLSNFKNVHKGKSVIVCGCGTSATIMKDHYEDIITIGVNDIPKLFTPTYLVVTDHPIRFAPPRRKLVMESSSKALFTCAKGWKNKNLVSFELGSRKLAHLDSDNRVDFCLNSPYVATGIAYKMGFTKIGLIGVDFTPNHFYARDGAHPLTRMNKIREVNEGYGILKSELLKRGVEFYNLSPSSAITAIPKMDIEKFKQL